MKTKLNRKGKIALLRAIRDGKVSIDVLQPMKTYFFIESNDRPGVYTCNGNEYNEAEYREFCDKIKSKRNNSIILNEVKDYVKEDTIIRLSYSERSTDTSGRRVTLDLTK